MLALISVAFA